MCIKYIYTYTYIYRERDTYIYRERDRQTDRQTDMDVREKHLLVTSHTCPNWGLNLQPSHVP